MQEALTIAGWLALVVFVLAALGDGRGYHLIRGLIAAAVWIIDRGRAWQARSRDRSDQQSRDAVADDE